MTDVWFTFCEQVLLNKEKPLSLTGFFVISVTVLYITNIVFRKNYCNVFVCLSKELRAWIVTVFQLVVFVSCNIWTSSSLVMWTLTIVVKWKFSYFTFYAQGGMIDCEGGEHFVTLRIGMKNRLPASGETRWEVFGKRFLNSVKG